MIIVAGTIDIKPEKHDDAVIAAQKMVAATEQEAGCITYRFYEDISQPNRFLVYEQWESAENLKAHFQTPHTAEFNAALNDAIVGRPNIKRFDDVNEVDIRS